MDVFQDPVCGMSVLRESALEARYGDRAVYFCSEFCKRTFERDPTKYLTRLVQAATRETTAGTLIAYFSMEVAVGSAIHTYSGGLGVLAGDMLRSAADLRVPLAGVTLLSRKGSSARSWTNGGINERAPPTGIPHDP